MEMYGKWKSMERELFSTWKREWPNSRKSSTFGNCPEMSENDGNVVRGISYHWKGFPVLPENPENMETWKTWKIWKTGKMENMANGEYWFPDTRMPSSWGRIVVRVSCE